MTFLTSRPPLYRHPDRPEGVEGSRLDLTNKNPSPATRFLRSAIVPIAPVGMTAGVERAERETAHDKTWHFMTLADGAYQRLRPPFGPVPESPESKIRDNFPIAHTGPESGASAGATGADGNNSSKTSENKAFPGTRPEGIPVEKGKYGKKDALIFS